MNIKKLEQWHRKSLPRYSGRELLEIFPEAKQIILVKLQECEMQHKKLSEYIKQRLHTLKKKCTEEDFLFVYEWMKLNEGEELIKIEKNILRLERLKAVSEGQQEQKGGVTKEEIDRAMTVPIEKVLDIDLRHIGNKLIGLCPFHKEKTPSFNIYTVTNSFYCFGCGSGGNIINLVTKFYGYSFVDSVKFILKHD